MKKSEFKEYLREEIIEILSEADTEKEIEDTKELTKAVQDLQKAKKEAGLTEEDEVEPTTADLKKRDSVSRIANKLGETTKEMKTLVKKYKDAEEPEKSKLLTRLKELTKIKKELEGLL